MIIFTTYKYKPIPGNDIDSRRPVSQPAYENKSTKTFTRLCFIFVLWLIVYLVDIISNSHKSFGVCVFLFGIVFLSNMPSSRFKQNLLTKSWFSQWMQSQWNDYVNLMAIVQNAVHKYRKSSISRCVVMAIASGNGGSGSGGDSNNKW